MSQSDLSLRHRFFPVVFSFPSTQCFIGRMYGTRVIRSIRWFFLHFRIEDDLCLTVYGHLVCCEWWSGGWWRRLTTAKNNNNGMDVELCVLNRVDRRDRAHDPILTQPTIYFYDCCRT